MNNLNLATNTRWVAMIPFSMIDENVTLEDQDFNLTSFNLPEMTMGSTTATYAGYEIAKPTGVRTGTKEVTFEYMISSDWANYKTLYKWANLIAKEDGSGSTVPLGTVMIPVRVFMLSEFENSVFEIVYHDCWISNFGEVSLDYQDESATEIKHTFTLTYSYFTFED